MYVTKLVSIFYPLLLSPLPEMFCHTLLTGPDYVSDSDAFYIHRLLHRLQQQHMQVALGVVAGKETEINRAHKNTQHKIPLYKSKTYTKPPKFSVPSFRRILVCNLTMVSVRPTTDSRTAAAAGRSQDQTSPRARYSYQL